MNTKAYIVLANGQVFEGKSFGATGCVTGEVVFTTGMTGYLETLTDPSNYGQIILQTFPLAGDYGIIRKDAESSKSHAVGFVAREWCSTPSNFRCEETLDQYLKEQGVIGVYDVDTRALTKILRDNGTMNARIVSFSGDAEKDIEAVQALNSIMHDLVLNPSLGNHARKIRLLEEIKEHKLENPVEKVSRSAASLQQENKAVFDAAQEYGAVPVDANGLKFATYEVASAMAGGSMLGTDSKWQDELGYEDSVEALKGRLMAQGHNQNHEPTVDLYMSFLADNFNWIVDENGGDLLLWYQEN